MGGAGQAGPFGGESPYFETNPIGGEDLYFETNPIGGRAAGGPRPFHRRRPDERRESPPPFEVRYSDFRIRYSMFPPPFLTSRTLLRPVGPAAGRPNLRGEDLSAQSDPICDKALITRDLVLGTGRQVGAGAMLCSENDRPSFLSELVGGPKTHDRLSPDCRGCLWTAVPIPMYIGTLAPARRGARARSNDGQERGEKNSASYLAREGSFSPASSRNAAQKAEATDSDRTLVNMGETAYSQGKDEASARSSAG